MFGDIIQDKNSQARAGKIKTDHGDILTPIFMPVGTQATVKTLTQDDLRETVQAQIILGNTYHLYLRPGTEIIKDGGGTHRFMNWDRPMLTDSGGYQVYSLSGQRKIKEEGVTFRSHIDGSKHIFSPESAIEVQRILGADIVMAFDECTPYPVDKKYSFYAMQRTHRWLDRCKESFTGQTDYGHRQVLAGIVQGSVFPDQRKESAQYIAKSDLPINAIGGLSVGEPHHLMYEMTEICCSILPKEKPRYLMGVGTPANILTCIGLGIDMFDCVLPSRNARHGLLYTWKGCINMKNAKWKNDFSPIDADSLSEQSRNHTKAYLSHLFRANEMLGHHIATLHNLTFYLELVGTARKQILDGRYREWMEGVLPALMKRI